MYTVNVIYNFYVHRTVQSLGVFDGAMLLGMKQYDIRAICPEEGSRVFFQLQSVRSTIAVNYAFPFYDNVNVFLYKLTIAIYLWSPRRALNILNVFTTARHV